MVFIFVLFLLLELFLLIIVKKVSSIFGVHTSVQPWCGSQPPLLQRGRLQDGHEARTVIVVLTALSGGRQKMQCSSECTVSLMRIFLTESVKRGEKARNNVIQEALLKRKEHAGKIC